MKKICYFILFVLLHGSCFAAPGIFLTSSDISPMNSKTPSDRAILAARAIRKMPGFKGISKKHLLEICRYIEMRLPSHVIQGRYDFPKKFTHLTRNIDYDPKNGDVYIHLENQVLGVGVYKVVSKTILYSTTNPQLFARSVQKKNMSRELSITQKLVGKPGIVEIRTFLHKKAGDRRITEIISKIYHPGSLHDVIERNISFTLKEKVGVILGMLRGLASMHATGYTHNDLGPRNLLLDIVKEEDGAGRTVTCVLADFGRSFAFAHAADKRAQGNKLYGAPEAIMRHLLKKSDYKKTDIFALGCTIHKFLYKQLFPWQRPEYLYDGRRGPDVLANMRLFTMVSHHTRKRRLELGKKARSGKIKAVEAIELVMLQMVNPYAHKRPSASTLRNRVKNIYNGL